MAVNTLDYKLNLDVSEVGMRMNEVRSQVATALGTPATDFGGAVSGLGAFAGAATSTWGMMQQGVSRAAYVGQTFTDPMTAYAPHYGMVQAQSTLTQEMAAYLRGPAGVAGMAPPGMALGDYSALLNRSLDQRIQDAKFGFVRGAAPVAADLLGFAVGAKVGGGLASLAGMGTIGSMALGIGGGLAVGSAAGYIVSEGIQRGEQITSEAKELGNIATQGRGFSLEQQFQFGRGFRDISRRMGISVQEMGDITAGIRGMGMMPRTRDVEESLRQFEGMASDIRQIASGMQVSLGKATAMLKDVERLGMGRGAGGVFAAAAGAERLGVSLEGLIAYVGQGAAVGRQAQVGGGWGGGIFMQMAQAGAQGMGALTGEEKWMVGGPLGLGRAFAMNAMQNALGPWGQVQMMAMRGGSGVQGLPGSAMGVVEQAAQNILGGGDPIANFITSETDRRRQLHQMGSKGAVMMQAQSIQGHAKMLMELSPGLTEQKALQFSAMQSGLGEHQARAMAGYIMRGFRDPAAGGIGGGTAMEGLPAVFGTGRTASMALRASQDMMARQAAVEWREENKMPWTRAIEAIGDKWSSWRQSAEIEAENRRRDYMASKGVFNPSQEALGMVTEAIRTGRSSFDRIDLSGLKFGPATSQFAGAMQLSGHTGPIGSYGLGELHTRLLQLGKNIAHSSRLTTSEQERTNKASLHIGKNIMQNEEKYKTLAENLRATDAKIRHGGAEAEKAVKEGWERAGYLEILKGTEYEKEFREKGFAGGRGAEIIKVLDRTMGALGRKVGDPTLAESLRARIQAGMGAAAYSLDVGAGSLADDALRLARGEKGDTEAARRRQAEDIAIKGMRRSYGSAISDDELRQALRTGKGNVGGINIPSDILTASMANANRIVAEQNKGDEGHKRAGEVIRNSTFQEYVKLRDTLYHKPYEKARDIVRADKRYDKEKTEENAKKVRDIGDALKKKGDDPEAQKKKEELEKKIINDVLINNPLAAKTAQDLLGKIKQGGPEAEQLMKKLSAYLPLEAKKGGTKRRRVAGGRSVKFQSSQESFQSQVATALRQTSHTLRAVEGTMKALSSKIGAPGPTPTK